MGRFFFWQLPLYLVLWCLVIELAIRMFLMSPNNVATDPELGWRWRPDSTFLIQTTDGGYRRVSVNALGFNDNPIVPKSGRLRLIALGDSFVEAFQVPREKNFLTLVQREMPKFQMINAGQAGLDPTSELIVFDRLDKELLPDGVIVVLNDGDRIDLLTSGIKVRDCPGSHDICGYRLGILDDEGAKVWLKKAMERSALLTFLLRKYKEQLGKALARIRQIEPRVIPGPQTTADSRNITSSDIEPLLKFVLGKIASRHPLIVLYIPTLEFTTDRRTRVVGSENFLGEVARATRYVGASFLNARDSLSDVYATTGQPPTGFDFEVIGSGHLNELGHKAIANALKSVLTNSGMFSVP